MKIKGIMINDFAGLHKVNLSLSDGVNIIKGKNESGKSRICAFIRYMLYGVQKKEDINRILSFGESSCSGAMTVALGEKLYRIERENSFSNRGGRLSVAKNVCRIADLSAMAEVETDKTPGELFFGVPAHIYSATAYINQIDGNKTGDSELSEAAANIIFSADENTSAAKAIKELDEVRVALYHKDRRGGRIADEAAKIDVLKAQLISMEEQSREMISLTGTCAELREKKITSDKRLAALNEFFAKYERWQIKNAKGELKKTLAEREEISEQAAKVRADISKNGFFPDAAYISELRSSSAKTEQAMVSALEAEEAEKNAVSAREKLSDRAAFFEKLNGHGGYARVREKNDKLKKKHKTSVAMMAAFITAAVVSALLAILGIIDVIPFFDVVNYALIGVAGVSAVAAFLFSVSASSCMKGLTALSAGFGMNISDFAVLLSALEGNEAATASVIEREKAAVAARERAAAAYFDAISGTRRVLSSAVDTSDISDEEILEFSVKAIEVIEKAHGEISALTSRVDAKTEYAKSIAEQLKRYSREEISAACNEEFDDEALSKINMSEKKRERDFLTNSQGGLTERLHDCEKRLSVLAATTTPAADIASEISRLSEKLDSDKRDFDAIILAMDAIKQSEAELKSSISPKIASKAGRIMKFLSDNKYDTLSVSQSFGLSYLDGGMTRDISYLSAGTSDIAYLALRIALVDTLFTGEKPPLVFDESFTRLDRDRLSALSRLTEKLSTDGIQCIMFCCDDRLSSFAGEKIELT